MTRTCSFWTVSPRLPDDLRRRSSARDHAGPVSHNHKKRTRGALTASLFVVPAPGPIVPGFLFPRARLIDLIGCCSRLYSPQTTPNPPTTPNAGPGPLPPPNSGVCLRRDARPSLSATPPTASPVAETLGPRPGIDTLSSPSPRTTRWSDIGVIVGTSGRGVPPMTHAMTPTAGKRGPNENDHGSPQDRLTGILHGRPKISTRHHEDTAWRPPPANPAGSHTSCPGRRWPRCLAPQAVSEPAAGRLPSAGRRPPSAVEAVGGAPGRKIHDRVPNGCAFSGRRR